MLHRDFQIDFNFAFSPLCQHGINETHIAETKADFELAHHGLAVMQEMGQLPFFTENQFRDRIHELQSIAEGLREDCDSIVIAGSELSLQALRGVLSFCKPDQNNASVPQIILWESHDEASTQYILDILHQAKTKLCIIDENDSYGLHLWSKFSLAYVSLKQTLSPERIAQKFLFFSKVPQKNTQPSFFSKFAIQEKCQNVELPHGSQAPLSIFMPQILVPAAYAGMHIFDFLGGAERMETRCKNEDIWLNPAGLFATVLKYFMLRKQDLHFHHYAFSPQVKELIKWYTMIFDACLGNQRSLQGNFSCAWSHSIDTWSGTGEIEVQSLFHTPPQSLILFWDIEASEQDISLTDLAPGIEEHPELSGKSLQEIKSAYRNALEHSLQEQGLAHLRFQGSYHDSYTLGQTAYLIERSLLVLAALCNVNPYQKFQSKTLHSYLLGQLGKEEMREFHGRIGRLIKNKRYII